ncbi:MAG TPA: serine acetyltransferase [Phycisphaerae bacterium]|nr:serine acetyltransferase [Phycisphaerae bacterium]
MSRFVNQNLMQITEEILASYDMDPKTQRIGERFLPSRTIIVEILEEIRRLIFPGFFGHKMLTPENVRYHVGNLIIQLSDRMTEQINYCICSSKVCGKCHEPTVCRQRADQITHDFIRRVPEIRGMLSLDAQAAFDGDPAAKSIDEIIYSYPGYYAVTVYRIAHELLLLGVPLMSRIMSEHAHSVTGTDIHPGAQIGKRFFIDHATGVVIGETCHIGDDVKIYQGVTLGALSFPRDERGRVIKGLQRHPTIEDGVTIYANATILGGQTVIGKGVTVGGNTFITESISADTTVAVKPAELKLRSKKTK